MVSVSITAALHRKMGSHRSNLFVDICASLTALDDWVLATIFFVFMDRDEVEIHKTVKTDIRLRMSNVELPSSLLKQKHMKEFLLYIFVLMFH